MNCKTKEDLISAVENKNILFVTRHGDSQDQVAERLELINRSIEKVDGKYQLGNIKFKTTVTTEAGKINKFKTITGNESVYEQQALAGNFLHNIIEDVVLQLSERLKPMSVKSGIIFLKSINSIDDISLEGLKKIETAYDLTLDPASIENVIRGAQSILLEVYRKQLQINTRTKTEGVPKIFTELQILDPKNSIGGTIDFLALLSDNSVILRDYKTKVNKKGKLVSWFDEQKYSFQIGSYMKILKSVYGVTGGSQRILPIRMSMAFNQKAKKLGKKISNVLFPGQAEDVTPYIPFSESTGFKGLDQLLANITSKIVRLESQIKTAENKEDIESRINILEKAKREVLLNHSFDSLVLSAETLINQVYTNDLRSMNVETLLEIKSELLMLGEIGKLSYEYRQYIKDTNNTERANKMESQITNVLGKIEDTLEYVNSVLLNEKAVQFIEAKTDLNLTDQLGNILPFVQEGMFGKYFYQLSQYDNPAFQTLRTLLNEANHNKREELQKIFDEVQSTENEVLKFLESQGKSYKDLYDIFVDPSTGNFYSRWSKNYATKYFDASAEELPNFLDVPEEFNEWYNTKLKNLQDTLANDDKLSDADRNSQIAFFKIKNSLELNKNGTPKYPQAWERHKAKLKHKNIEFSNEFNQIQSIPQLLKYYEMFEKYNKYFRDILGVEYSNLPNNFIPNIRKDLAERIDTLGIASGIMSNMNDFIRQFNINEEDRDLNGQFDERKSIPIFFLNPFRNKEGEISVTEKSFQLSRSLMLFANMALNFREMNNIEAHVQMLRDFLAERGEELLTKKGKLQKDMVGNTIVQKLDLDMLNIFDRYVDMYLYGISVQPTLLDKDGKLEKALMTAKNYFSLKSLGFNVVAAGGSFLAAKYNVLVEGNKGIIYTKSDYLNSFKLSANEREKFLALNAFIDPMGHRVRDPQLSEKTYGELSIGDQSKRGFINQYVNSRLLMRPFSLGDEYIDEHILVSMAQNFYVDFKGNLRRFKNHTINDDGTINTSDVEREKFKGRTVWDLFSYENGNANFKLDQDVQKKVIISFREAVQAGQSKIKGTIPEEDKAYWQSQIIGNLMMQFKSWMPGIMFERWGKVKFDPRIDSLYMGKFTALYQEFKSPESMMRATWFKEIFLPKLWALTKQLATFGYYKKTDVYQKQMLFAEWLDNHPQYKDKVTFEDFYIIQQQQLKSAMREMRVLIAFSLIIALLAGDWDDDGQRDYRKYLLTRKLIALLNKMNQEMAFVYNPNDLASMVKTPLPMMGLVTDTTHAIANTVDELLDVPFGEERLIGGQIKDKTQIGYYSHKLVPGGNVLDLFDIWKQDTPR